MSDQKFTPEMLVEANEQLITALKDAKTELIHKLETELKNIYETRNEDLGGGTLEVVGKDEEGPDLLPFKWIEVTYTSVTGDKENYNLALSQQLLDKKTGNPHTAFGKLQFWHNLRGDAEVGYNPNECSKNEDEKYYSLKYFAEKAYPAALTLGSRGGATPLPWGLKSLQLQLDMAHPDYDPEEVAKTFIHFVMEDIMDKRKKMEAQKSNPEKSAEDNDLSKANEQLIDILKVAKAALIKELNEICETRNEDHDGGTLEVYQKGNTGNGVGDLKPYKWIVVTYEYEGHKEEYDLALSQQLLDTNTGNPHTAFGKLQFWHDLRGKTEVGGNPNKCSKNKKEEYYFLKYFAEKAYPVALTQEHRDKSAYPWGLKSLDKTDEWPCSDELKLAMADPYFDLFDMADSHYKPDQMARIFIHFVMEDLTAKGIIPPK